MAHIIGLATEEEIEELKRRGWKIEDPPEELICEDQYTGKSIMVFVDNTIFNIMNGPDWDHGEEGASVRCKIDGPHCQILIEKYKAHLHDGEWVCENCWDERLRTME